VNREEMISRLRELGWTDAEFREMSDEDLRFELAWSPGGKFTGPSGLHPVGWSRVRVAWARLLTRFRRTG
jgi:hypothetical protein